MMRIIELPPAKQASLTESVAMPSTTITTTARPIPSPELAVTTFKVKNTTGTGHQTVKVQTPATHSQSPIANEPPRYHDNNIDQFKATPQDQLDEYEARLEFAKQESRTYIFNLRQQLSLAESRIASLESENEELHAFRLDAESREDHIHGRFSELVVEFDRLQSYCYEQEETEKGLIHYCLFLLINFYYSFTFAAMISENEQLRKAVEEMANDLELVSARLEHEKKQAFKQEADFELFSKKIKSQQLLIAYVSFILHCNYEPPYLTLN